MEAGEEHINTATTAAAVQSSLRPHHKINQKISPGKSKFEASGSPGRLPGGTWEAPGRLLGVLMTGNPVPERMGALRAFIYVDFYLKLS